MSTESHTEELPGRANFYSDEPVPAAPKKRSTFEDDALWERSAEAPWKLELLTIFLRNQLRIAPAMPLLTFMLALTSLMWVPPLTAMLWLAVTLASQGIQIYLCANFFHKERSESEQHDWIGMMAASELVQGVCWGLPLFLFWAGANSLQAIYLVSFIMAIIAVRLLVVNNFMPVLVAGTGVMTVAVAIRCASQNEPIFIALAGLIIVLEAFFLFIARQLGDTARDMVKFKSQKDTLIDELKLERDRAEAEKIKAEAANKAKSTFLATMSHELRTPLNAIMGFSEILKREMFGPLSVPAYKDYAGDIHHSGTYLLDLINDILDLSRIEAGRREIQEEPFDILACVISARALLSGKAKEKSIAVNVEITPTLPKLLGDLRGVNQIVINLLTNAIKFTPSGGKVVISAARNASGGMVMSVKDNGPGIPAHEVQSVLTSFSRGSLATKEAVDGAGLGLSIVKGLMDLHGGEVSILSELGKGTEVLVTFPAHRVLTGPRGEVIAAQTVQSESQRKLISITG
jgi:two-component system, cell cycle sensor histidine kinase PleC